MIKKLFGTLCLILSFSLFQTGCSEKNVRTQTNADESISADETFIDDMAFGLQSRWKLNENDESKERFENISFNSEEYKTMIINYIDAELNTIDKYENEKFEDSNLKELAIRYINLLKQHKDICQYITVDYTKYEEEYTSIYNERSKIISQMVNDYNMSVSEEYQSTLDEFIVNSNLVNEKETQQQAIETMLNSVTFELTADDGYGWKTYQGIIENTSGIDFNNISLNINLLDSECIIIETTYDQISAFSNGVKARLEINTDKEFASTQITADWWD